MGDGFGALRWSLGPTIARFGARTSADDDPRPSDEALAERVRATGDTAAFAQIVGRYRGRLIVLARRMLADEHGVRDEAEDVAQEAFVAAFHKRHTYRRGTPYRPWLYRIAVNRCLDRLRVSARTPTAHGLDDLPEPIEPDADTDPLRAILAGEEESRIGQAVALLPPRYRMIFLLRHLDDLSYEEIAAATELPIGTVKTHLFRARAQMRRTLTEYFQP